MSQSSDLLYASGEFSYCSNNNLKTLQNVYAPQTPCPANLLTELIHEVKSLKNSPQTATTKIDVLAEEVQQCRKTIGKLTEEVITVKLENGKHHNSTTFKHNTRFDKLPFLLKVDLTLFNDELLDEFKNSIGKVGGDGQSMFLRCAVRKVFTDEFASLFSWNGTNEKPSIEK